MAAVVTGRFVLLMGVFYSQLLLIFVFAAPLLAGAESLSLGVSQQRPTYVTSWYGARYHGRLTASGERFDMHELTAAHRDLPFGVRLRVTAVDTGRTVVVKVNDRGPFIEGRDLDLSFAAARELGIDKAGLAKVYVEEIGD